MTCRVYTPTSRTCIHGDGVTESERSTVASDFESGLSLVVQRREEPVVRGFVPALRSSPEAFFAVVEPDPATDPLSAYADAVTSVFDAHDGWSIRTGHPDGRLLSEIGRVDESSASPVPDEARTTPGTVLGVPDDRTAIGAVRTLLGVGGSRTARSRDETTSADTERSCETVVVSRTTPVSHVEYDVLVHIGDYDETTVVETLGTEQTDRLEASLDALADGPETAAAVDHLNDRLSEIGLGFRLGYGQREWHARVDYLTRLVAAAILLSSAVFTGLVWFQFGGKFRLLLGGEYVFLALARQLPIGSAVTGGVTLATVFAVASASVLWPLVSSYRVAESTDSVTRETDRAVERITETLDLLTIEMDSDPRAAVGEAVADHPQFSVREHPLARRVGRVLTPPAVFACVGTLVWWFTRQPSVSSVVTLLAVGGLSVTVAHQAAIRRYGRFGARVGRHGVEVIRRVPTVASQVWRRSRRVGGQIRRRVPITGAYLPAAVSVDRVTDALDGSSREADESVVYDDAPLTHFAPIGRRAVLVVTKRSDESDPDAEQGEAGGREATESGYSLTVLEPLDEMSETYDRTVGRPRRIEVNVSAGITKVSTDEETFAFREDEENGFEFPGQEQMTDNVIGHIHTRGGKTPDFPDQREESEQTYGPGESIEEIELDSLVIDHTRFTLWSTGRLDSVDAGGTQKSYRLEPSSAIPDTTESLSLDGDRAYGACASEGRVWWWHVDDPEQYKSNSLEVTGDVVVRDGFVYVPSGDTVHRIDAEKNTSNACSVQKPISDFTVVEADEAGHHLLFVAGGKVRARRAPKVRSNLLSRFRRLSESSPLVLVI